jgi:hypothetical protein
MKLPGTIPITKPSNPPPGAYPKTVGVSVLSPNVESMKNYTENIEEQQAHLAASHHFRQL